MVICIWLANDHNRKLSYSEVQVLTTFFYLELIFSDKLACVRLDTAKEGIGFKVVSSKGTVIIKTDPLSVTYVSDLY